MGWWFLLLAFGLWYFGTPFKTAAEVFWPNSPAPWETVEAYYYPNEFRHGLPIESESLAKCRATEGEDHACLIRSAESAWFTPFYIRVAVEQ